MQKTAPVVGLALFWSVVFVVLVVLAARTKPATPLRMIELTIADNANTTPALYTGQDGNIWEFQLLMSGRLAFVWTKPNNDTFILWDSVNLGCKDNVAPREAYRLAYPSGPTYSDAHAYIIGVTPISVDANGLPVQFRLIMYEGDVRIESMTGDNAYWSIFGPYNGTPNPFVGYLPLAAWPSAVQGVLWQSTNLAGNLVAQFQSNGELLVKIPDQIRGFWSASSLMVPAPC